jgi:hypothetical protein
VDGDIRTLELLKAPTVLVLHDFTNRGFQAASILLVSEAGSDVNVVASLVGPNKSITIII